jgi:prepilin-type N-terminal cleavage/methylation domain-containing protein
MRPFNSNHGFTLIELMIVVAIIAIVAAIAIPSLANARMSANEASAISSLRTLTTVGEQYRTRFGTYASGMAPLLGAGYIDDNLASGTKSGYDFFYAGGAATWVCLANPRFPGTSGTRYFWVNERGVIRFSDTPVAGSSDPPLD